MDYEEFIRLKGGLRPAKANSEFVFTASPIEATPASVDWRDFTPSVMNPVQNQQQCGSCWAFSTIATVESRYAIQEGMLFKLSEQQLVDCDRDRDQGCNGGLMDNAFTYLETHGAMLEKD